MSESVVPLRSRRLLLWLPPLLAVVFLIYWSSNAEPLERNRQLGSPLDRCPASPNCVCSEVEDDDHFIKPFALEGDPGVAWQKLIELVQQQPRTKIVEQTDEYLRATSTTAIFRFVDDLEFRLDEGSSQIHVRSASRVGYSDLGVNRRRIEHLRSAFK